MQLKWQKKNWDATLTNTKLCQMQRDFIDQKKIHITNNATWNLWENINTHNSLVQLAGLSMRWPSFSSLKSSSTGIPGYGDPPSVKISHIKTPNDQLEETDTHSSDHFTSATQQTRSSRGSYYTFNQCFDCKHSESILAFDNQYFVQIFSII